MSLRTVLQLLLVVVLFINYSNACGKGKGKGNNSNNNPPPGPNPPPPPSGGSKDPFNSAQRAPFDNSGYDAKNGQASGPGDLKCDFESPCCWKNTKPPYDTMDYSKISNVDPNALQSAFGTSTAPSGNALGLSASPAAGPNDKAEFESCVIPCAGDSIKVTLKHWVSSGVKLQVCEVAQADPSTLLNCQDVPSASPGPDTVSLPPGSNLILTLVATNFVTDGAACMIDEISVDYPPCAASSAPPPGTTQAGPPPPGPTSAPAADTRTNLCCDFSSALCNYNKGAGPAGGGTVNDFQKAGPDRFKNPATGVPPSPDKSYSACYMKPKDKCYMEASADMPSPTVIKFAEYKATQDIDFKACCDSDASCTYDTGDKVEKADFRQWYAGSIQCPAGSKKVVFVTNNNGVNEGGVGIDNIEVYDGQGNKICPTP